jgi:hypothetical protein
MARAKAGEPGQRIGQPRLRHHCHKRCNLRNRLALSSLPRLERDGVFGKRAKTETGGFLPDRLDFFRCQIDSKIAPFIDGNARPWKMGQKGIANLHDKVEIALRWLRRSAEQAQFIE